MVKNSSANAGDARDMGLIPGLGRSSGEGNGNPLHCSCLGSPTDRRAWWAAAYGVSSVRRGLSAHSTGAAIQRMTGIIRGRGW